MSNKYAEALGVLEMNVGGVDIELEPVKGDNRRLLKMQQEADENIGKLLDAFIPFGVELLNRETQYAKDSKDYEKIELFVDRHCTTLLEELMIAFKHVTREELEKAKEEGLGFLSNKA